MRFSTASAAAALATLPAAFAQTSTDCNPTEQTCPADTGLPASSYSADFTKSSSANATWSAAAYTTINYGNQGAEFTIAKAGQAPTLQTDFYIFFGRIDVKMRAASGTGIVSSIVLESDDLDEIDWEFLGGNTAQVETNFFGKGNTTTYDRATYYAVSTPQDTFHTYTIDWNSDRIEFIIDGTVVRTLAYTDPLMNGGTNYPQTPMRLKLGNWAAGAPGEPQGTVQWAGGQTDFSQGPFTMYVESVDIQNYNPADSYEFGDQSGSWQSIKIVNGGSASNPSGGSGGKASPSGSSATVAPMSSVSVAPVMQTAAAVSSTRRGSSYSVNSAFISAQNIATSEVAGYPPTATGAAGGANGSGAAVGPNAAGGTATNSAGAASQTSSGAALNAMVGAGSLFGVALSFFLL